MGLEFVEVFDAVGDGFEDAVEDGDGEGADAVGDGDGGFEFAEGVVLLSQGLFDDIEFFAEEFDVVVDLLAISMWL